MMERSSTHVHDYGEKLPRAPMPRLQYAKNFLQLQFQSDSA